MSTNELLAFVDRLNRSGLLDAARLRQVSRQLLPASADAEALARALIARRWLTAPQARDLLAGRTPAAPAAVARRAPAAPPARRASWVWVAVGALAAAVVVVVGLVLLVQHLRQRPAAPGEQQLAAGANPGEAAPDDGGKLRRLVPGDPAPPPKPPAQPVIPPPVTPRPEAPPPAKPGMLTPEPLPIPKPPTLPEVKPGITYLFNDTLAAQETGVPALTPTDPLGMNTFETTAVFGRTQRVYDFVGNANPVDQQAGLTFDNSGGLLPGNNYSIEMVLEFLQADNAWRRIVDVQDRQSDDGFYADPGNHLQVYPLPGSGKLITAGGFHHVVLTVADTGTAAAYMDGARQFTGSTHVMDINNPRNVVHFFLDNTTGPGQGEFSNGKIALIRLYNSVLSDEQVSRLASVVRGALAARADPAVVKDVAPDPGTLAGLQNQVGNTYDFRVTGAATGSVWGTDVYTADSALAAAAVHAGVLRPGETGVVRVQMVAGLPAYAGSTRHGVTSAGWNSYPAAYTVRRVSAGRD